MAKKRFKRGYPEDAGPEGYQYTIEDVARAAGRKVRTVLGHRSKLSDLTSVACYVQRSRIELSVVIDPSRWCPSRLRERWEGRWPRLDYYCCPVEGCKSHILGAPSFCEDHGGGRPAWRMVDGYMRIRVSGAYVQLHKMLLPCDDGFDVHHVDLNAWNNRAENLVAMLHEEHFALHRSLL
jgi:hypothetical protein